VNLYIIPHEALDNDLWSILKVSDRYKLGHTYLTKEQRVRMGEKEILTKHMQTKILNICHIKVRALLHQKVSSKIWLNIRGEVEAEIQDEILLQIHPPIRYRFLYSAKQDKND
jgi:hypothetical protein